MSRSRSHSHTRITIERRSTTPSATSGLLRFSGSHATGMANFGANTTHQRASRRTGAHDGRFHSSRACTTPRPEVSGLAVARAPHRRGSGRSDVARPVRRGPGSGGCRSWRRTACHRHRSGTAGRTRRPAPPPGRTRPVEYRTSAAPCWPPWPSGPAWPVVLGGRRRCRWNRRSTAETARPRVGVIRSGPTVLRRRGSAGRPRVCGVPGRSRSWCRSTAEHRRDPRPRAAAPRP